MRATYIAILAAATLLWGCQTMSVEEAKKVTTSFQGTAFVPPPRTITDIVKVLEHTKPDEKVIAEARAKADAKPPATNEPGQLADFYYTRARAAQELGRTRQELDDFRQAWEYAQRGTGQIRYHVIGFQLGFSEIFGGNLPAASGTLRTALGAVPTDDAGWRFSFRAMLTRLYVAGGDFAAAEAEIAEYQRLLPETRSWQRQRSEWIAGRRASLADIQGRLAEGRGRLTEAEAFYRDAIAEHEADAVLVKDIPIDITRARLVNVLVKQGRLIEAEHQARVGVLSVLRKRGRYAPVAANNIRVLATVLLAQGRYTEAETILR
ncbi:MAG: tetratricopeptide repeat protein, partial [Candidatus Rokubacteria bacterium]|nr:tetratricopeptide repeat protein [Candidatus Rokubacteria bacterium]